MPYADTHHKVGLAAAAGLLLLLNPLLPALQGIVTGVVEGTPDATAPAANITNSALYKLALGECCCCWCWCCCFLLWLPIMKHAVNRHNRGWQQHTGLTSCAALSADLHARCCLAGLLLLCLSADVSDAGSGGQVLMDEPTFVKVSGGGDRTSYRVSVLQVWHLH
jgi:hypothetical protein